MEPDHYARLEVDPRAGSTVIEAAYRALIQGRTAEGQQPLKDAFIIVGDSKKRAAYASAVAEAEGAEAAGGVGSPQATRQRTAASRSSLFMVGCPYKRMCAPSTSFEGVVLVVEYPKERLEQRVVPVPRQVQPVQQANQVLSVPRCQTSKPLRCITFHDTNLHEHTCSVKQNRCIEGSC